MELEDLLKLLIAAGIVLTVGLAVNVVVNKNKVSQKSKGNNSPNINIGSVRNSSRVNEDETIN